MLVMLGFATFNHWDIFECVDFWRSIHRTIAFVLLLIRDCRIEGLLLVRRVRTRSPQASDLQSDACGLLIRRDGLND